MSESNVCCMAHAGQEKPFTPAELVSFQEEDRHAAKAIVCIMCSISLLAVVAYTYIAVWVTGSPYMYP